MRHTKRIASGIRPGLPLTIGYYLSVIARDIVVHHKYPGALFLPIVDNFALTLGAARDNIYAGSIDVAAAYLALGLDARKATLYRQSDVPETLELVWYLSQVERALARQGGSALDTLERHLLISADILGARCTLAMLGAPSSAAGNPDLGVLHTATIALNINRELGDDVLPIPEFGLSSSALGLWNAPLSDAQTAVLSCDWPLFEPHERRLERLNAWPEANVRALTQLARRLHVIDASVDFGLAPSPDVVADAFRASLENAEAKYRRLKNAPDHLDDVIRAGATHVRPEFRRTIDSIRRRFGLGRGRDARDLEAIKRMEALDIRAFVDAQRERGRSGVPSALIDEWCALHTLAKDVLNDVHRSDETTGLADLLHGVSFAVARIKRDKVPTYYSYADVGLLDWYSRADRESSESPYARVYTALDAILAAHRKYEALSLEGRCPYAPQGLDSALLPRRLAEIDATRALIAPHLPPSYGAPPGTLRTLREYAFESSRLSCLYDLLPVPQSTWHDEVLFLAIVIASEFAFYGLRIAVVAATEAISLRDADAATRELDAAVELARVLHGGFRILRTMPPSHFASFRDHTGRASAVQSRNYQLLDIALRGVDRRKVEVFRNIPHLRDLALYAHPALDNLASSIRSLSAESSGSEVVERARELDRSLLSWRGLHLAFAQAYLPTETGTGGTAGAPYLRSFLYNGIFTDTAMDWAVIDEAFADIPEVPHLVRARCGVKMAPENDQFRTWRPPAP